MTIRTAHRWKARPSRRIRRWNGSACVAASARLHDHAACGMTNAELHTRHPRCVDEEGRRYVCGAPLFEVSDLRRLPAATIARRMKKFFGLLGVDEVHKCKAKGTGVGWALTVLNNACRYTVGLTGTLFGGYSTSIFWLMHRLSGEIRREFGYSDERRWVEKYGLLKTTFYVEIRKTSKSGWRLHGHTRVSRSPSRPASRRRSRASA